jgi:long-chain acyl-CoA synthetase
MTEIEQRVGGAVDEAAFTGARSVGEMLAARPAAGEAPIEYARWARWAPARWFRHLFLASVVLPLTRRWAPAEVRGREHLADLPGPVIFASNHQSIMDVPAILAALPARIRYRAAPAMSKELFPAHFHPAGRPLAERLWQSLQYYLAALCFNAFPLPQRESGVGGALRYAGELAAAGWSLLIFPEGERTAAGELQPFQPGVALMSARLALPVVPVRLQGLEKVWHRDARGPTRGPIRIAFGAPMMLGTGDWRELAQQVRNAVAGL